MSRPSSAGLPPQSYGDLEPPFGFEGQAGRDAFRRREEEKERDEEDKQEEDEPLRVGEFSLYSDRLDYEYRQGDCISGKLRLVVESGLLPIRRLVVTFRGISSVR